MLFDFTIHWHTMLFFQLKKIIDKIIHKGKKPWWQSLGKILETHGGDADRKFRTAFSIVDILFLLKF